MSTPAMRSAIADAVEGMEGDDGTEDSEAASTETPTPAASAEGTEQAVETPQATDDGGADSEAREGTEDEPPTEYFGTPLPGTPDQRRELIEALKKRDDTIGTLLRDRVPSETPEEEVEPEPPTMPTDAEILAALGLDPENNPFDEQAAKVALPLVKRQMQQDQTLAQMLETQELAEIDRTWRSGLSGLEREFGSLPAELDHDRVMEFAADNGITSPVDAYWRLVGPGRAAVSDEMKRAEAAQRLASKKAVSSTRPSSSTADEDPALKATNVKGATREVARRMLADLGLGD